MFKPNTLFYSDGYKPGHKRMLAAGTTRLYGTWICRTFKFAPKGVEKAVSFGQQLTWKWIHDEFTENFFGLNKTKAMQFARDMSLYLGQEYDGKHFGQLWELGYLPIEAKALPEGIETLPGIPHQTFINTVDGFAWLTLYLETIVSALSWKASTSATIALQYRRNVTEWVMKTCPEMAWLIPYLCHDFSARGLDPFSMLSSGLGHATSFRGSDSIICIPGARYFYGEPEDEVCINSVNASEHSVSTTKIFTVGEKQMIIDWLKEFPTGTLSIVADTFDLWKLLVEYLADPEVKALIMARYGKLVIRPDSGDPVDIICGLSLRDRKNIRPGEETPTDKGVIEILADIFGTTTSSTGYKILDSHIGCIYGDSITLERQIQIYERLAAKGFAATNIVLGVGSFTYQYNTRDTLGWAAKGSWFEVNQLVKGTKHLVKRPPGDDWKNDIYEKIPYNIYKDPVTDDGRKKSLKGLLAVFMSKKGEYFVQTECTWEMEKSGELQTIYKDGKFYNQTTLKEVRERIDKLVA